MVFEKLYLIQEKNIYFVVMDQNSVEKVVFEYMCGIIFKEVG